MSYKSTLIGSWDARTQSAFAVPSAQDLKKNGSNDTAHILRQKIDQQKPRLPDETFPDQRINTASTTLRSTKSCESIFTKVSPQSFEDRFRTLSSSPASSVLSISLNLNERGTEINRVCDRSHEETYKSPTLENNLNNQNIRQHGVTLEARKPDPKSRCAPGILDSSVSTEENCRLGFQAADNINHLTQETLHDLYDGGGDLELTSYPRQTIIEQELKTSLLSLLSIQRFESILSKPATRNIFRDWLIKTGTPENSLRTTSPYENLIMLDRWTEESRINQLCKETQRSAREVLYRHYDVHEQGMRMDGSLGREDRATLAEIVHLATPEEVLTCSRRRILESLYATAFKHFITCKLLEVTRMKLRSDVHGSDCEGLGDSFVVTNPRLRDNPIIMVSAGFSATTGYEGNSIIGRNCRFLQGPGTSLESVKRLKLALKQGLPCVELILNYREDGTPFYCLLSIIPLFDESGSLKYYIGGQVNVTDELRKNEIISMISQTSATPQKLTASDFVVPACMPYVAENRTNVDLNRSTSTSNCAHFGTEERSSGSGAKAMKATRLNWIASKVKTEKRKKDLSFKKLEDRSGGDDYNLRDSLSTFQSTYSQLILFRQSDRSILFVTPEALAFLGLPTTTLEERYASSLLHNDFMDLVENCKTSTKNACSKRTLKKIISSNASATFECDLCWSYVTNDTNVLNAYRDRKKVQHIEPCVIHLTPLKDESGDFASYVAILS